MDDLAKLARKMGGWEKLARAFYRTLIPYLEAERNKRREEEVLGLGKIWGGQVKSRGRPTKKDFLWTCKVLDALEQSQRGKPHENATYHWQKVARKLNPGLSAKNEDAAIKTLRNNVSDHKKRIRQVQKLFPKGNIPPMD